MDYFLARYYSSAQGRFTSVDPLLESAKRNLPQSWNRYTYALNNPLRYTDPTGEEEFERDITRKYEFTLDDRNQQTGALVHQARVEVTEVEHQIVNEKGDVLDTSTKATVTVTNTGQGAEKFSEAKLDIIKQTTKDIVEVSRDKGVEPAIMLGIGAEESRLGVGRAGSSDPAKAPAANPTQLSGGRASPNDPRGNIAGSIEVWQWASGGGRTLNESLQRYNGEPTKAIYARKAEGDINTIRASVKQTHSDRPLRAGFN